jgi:hypothetical protein
MEKYNIYNVGKKIFSAVSEEKMMEITQNLADDFYKTGTPHPDDIVVEYIGCDIDE